MLREMIVNLVDNAMRYTPSGGSVGVSIRRSDGFCVLTVADMVRESLRTNGHAFSSGSIGSWPTVARAAVWPAIVQEVVNVAGGTIDLQDPPEGHGLVVEVKIPRRPAENDTRPYLDNDKSLLICINIYWSSHVWGANAFFRIVDKFCCVRAAEVDLLVAQALAE